MSRSESNPSGGAQPFGELKRSCPSCKERFAARLRMCPACGTNYERARGLGATARGSGGRQSSSSRRRGSGRPGPARPVRLRMPGSAASDSASPGTARPEGGGPVPLSQVQQARVALQRTCPNCKAKFPAELRACDSCGTNYESARGMGGSAHAGRPGSADAIEGLLASRGVVGGLILIGVAVVWFVIGWQNGYIFFYPPILALIGVGAIVSDLLTRSDRRRARQRSARRRRR